MNTLINEERKIEQKPGERVPGELRRVAFFGRRLEDYERMFGFDRAELEGERVLDVAAGSASFAAELNELGIEVKAVDPCYRLRPRSVLDRTIVDFKEMKAYVHENLDRLNLTVDAVEAHFENRDMARRRFLEDYPFGIGCGRYQAGSLPVLRFEDASFDRVFCGHFLFLYSQFFDFGFHLNALRELVRVARKEVRIYPLLGLRGERYPHLEALLSALAEEGIESVLNRGEEGTLTGSRERLILYPKKGRN